MNKPTRMLNSFLGSASEAGLALSKRLKHQEWREVLDRPATCRKVRWRTRLQVPGVTMRSRLDFV